MSLHDSKMEAEGFGLKPWWYCVPLELLTSMNYNLRSSPSVTRDGGLKNRESIS